MFVDFVYLVPLWILMNSNEYGNLSFPTLLVEMVGRQIDARTLQFPSSAGDVLSPWSHITYSIIIIAWRLSSESMTQLCYSVVWFLGRIKHSPPREYTKCVKLGFNTQTQTQTQKSFIQSHIIQTQFSHTFSFKIMGQAATLMWYLYVHVYIIFYIDMHIYIIIHNNIWLQNNKYITYIYNKLDWILCYEVVWVWGWAMDQWTLCYMEMETEQHVIHVINSHSIHM